MKVSMKCVAKVLAVAVVLAAAFGFLGQGKTILAQDDQMAPLKEKITESMKDVTIIATGIVDYITDNGIAPTQDGTYEVGDDFYNKISPFYVKVLPVKDPWGGKYVVYCGLAANGKYGIKNCKNDDFVVVCLGRDGKKDDWQYNESDPAGGLFQLTSLADVDRDLVMFDGSWIRAPETR